MRNLFFSILLTAGAIASDVCSIRDTVVLAVLEAESHPKKGIGYQYLISFNDKREAKLVKDHLPNFFIDNRTIDCQNMETCTLLTKKLFEAGFKNLDIGAFQINSYFHKRDNIEDYFNYEKSYKAACGYLEKMVDKHGYNWFAIASYNSQTLSNNVVYQRRLINNYFGK